MPKIDDLLHDVQSKKSKIFSVLDLKGAFNKLTIDERDRWTIGFTWDNIHYQFKGCPFGPKTVPYHWSTLIRNVLAVFDFCQVYIDDIIVFSKNIEEHAKYIRMILKQLTKYQLDVNPDKCSIRYHSVSLLGYIISEEGIALNLVKLESIKDWKRPTTGKQVQQLLGFVNYFRRYFLTSVITKPFSDLLYKRKFEWTEELEMA